MGGRTNDEDGVEEESGGVDSCGSGDSWLFDLLMGSGKASVSAEADMGVDTARGESLLPLLEASESDRPMRPLTPPTDSLRPLSVHPEPSLGTDAASTSCSIDASDGALDFRELVTEVALPEKSEGGEGVERVPKGEGWAATSSGGGGSSGPDVDLGESG